MKLKFIRKPVIDPRNENYSGKSNKILAISLTVPKKIGEGIGEIPIHETVNLTRFFL
jgi:hypothetical protein